MLTHLKVVLIVKRSAKNGYLHARIEGIPTYNVPELDVVFLLNVYADAHGRCAHAPTNLVKESQVSAPATSSHYVHIDLQLHASSILKHVYHIPFANILQLLKCL